MFSCDTQKQQKLHSLLLAPFFSYKTLTCLLNNKYYLFCYEKQSTMLSHQRYVIHYKKIGHAVLCNAAKTVHMEIVVFILYSNKKLLIYHFHQETSSIVFGHLVEIVTYDIFFTSFAVYVKKA